MTWHTLGRTPQDRRLSKRRVIRTRNPLEYKHALHRQPKKIRIEDGVVGKPNTQIWESDDLPRKRCRGVIALFSFRATLHNRNGWSISSPGATIATFMIRASASTVMSIEPSATVLPAPPRWKASTAYKTAPIAVSHTPPMMVSTMNVVLNAVI